MIRPLLLVCVAALLGYGFWISPDFKQIAAGVAIFLFGMLAMEEGFKAFSGGVLERVLRKSTERTWKSLSFGMVSTTLMQSSSLVSVITISFLSAGLIGLHAGIGIIFGANLGTTTGAWLVAGLGLKVSISAYAMPLLVFGILLIFQKSRNLKGLGYILAGLGFLFLGIHHMKEGFEAFRDTVDLSRFAVSGIAGLLIFTGIGLAATVIMQSSHATLVLIITALDVGHITYVNAIALAIGSNVGTTITAIIGALGANPQGKRLAGAHLIFNVVTAVVALIFITQFIRGVDFIALHTGIRDADYTLKLALFHTLFNAVGVVLMLPFIDRLVRLLRRLIPEVQRKVSTPRFLSSASINVPAAAVVAARRELEHLFDNAFDVIARALNLSPGELRSSEDLHVVVSEPRQVRRLDVDQYYEVKIKNLYGEIVSFIALALEAAPSREADQLNRIRAAARDTAAAVKGIKHLQKNLLVHLASDNPLMREQYDAIRTRLAKVMREIADLSGQPETERSTLDLDAVELELRNGDIQVDGTLDQLIRSRKLNAALASSLMNDNRYAHDVAHRLIALARLLYEPVDETTRAVQEEVTLASEDLAAVAEGEAPQADQNGPTGPTRS
ncbi:MAG: Na/Pi cotransporter family protein [Gammaproteobacteria bacterium]